MLFLDSFWNFLYFFVLFGIFFTSWYYIVLYGTLWHFMVLYVAFWYSIIPNGTLLHMDQYASKFETANDKTDQEIRFVSENRFFFISFVPQTIVCAPKGGSVPFPSENTQKVLNIQETRKPQIYRCFCRKTLHGTFHNAAVYSLSDSSTYQLTQLCIVCLTHRHNKTQLCIVFLTHQHKE